MKTYPKVKTFIGQNEPHGIILKSIQFDGLAVNLKHV